MTGQKTYLSLIIFFLIARLYAVEVNEKTRLWTKNDGKKARAALVEITEKNITLEIKGKNHTFALNDFSSDDRDYVWSVLKSLPKGKLEDYPLKFKVASNEVFYKQHGMKSLLWRGKTFGDIIKKMPLLVYEPKVVGNQKMPVIIYLHGTGGLGSDNIKPFFHDGGGVAKKLLDETFQKKHPCYVITPQVERHSAWFCAHFTDPSREQKWLKHALRVMAQDKRFRIDLDRIYIMGLSMGGHGVYEALAKLPDFYAAGVAIAAVDDGQSLLSKNNCKRPLWVILNKGDRAERVENLEKFAAKYRKFGGNIKVTIYEKGGHNAWDKALGDKKFIDMLFRQKKR